MPTTQMMQISGVNSRLNSLFNDAYWQDLTDRRRKNSGIPVAAIIPVADLRRLIRLDESGREAVASMQAAFVDVPEEEIERQTERIMNEVREENRAARQPVAKIA